MMKKLSKRHSDIAKTSALYFSYLCVGLCLSVIGPTLLDLQEIVHVDVQNIGFVYLARSGSALVGSLIGGFLFDWARKKLLLLALGNCMMAISILGTPWCQDIVPLIFMFILGGVGLGALDTGTNVLCLNIWGKDCAPYFQALHFLFGVGGFLGPLIAEPFLMKPCDHNLDVLSTSYNNSPMNLSAQLNSSSLLTLQNFTAKNSSYNLSTIPCENYTIPPIVYSYSIIGSITMLVAAYFLLLSFICSEEEKPPKKENNVEKAPQDSLVYVITVVLITQLLLGLDCGIEIGYGQMLTTFTVKGDLKLTKNLGSFMTACFWGTFTFSRGVSVYLATKFSSFTLVFGDLVAVLIGSLILIAFGNTHVEAMWAGTVFLGIGIASFYPAVITWVEEYIEINNKIASWFVVAATFGEMTVPIIVSRFMESQPRMLLYIVVACNIGTCLTAFVQWLIMNKKGKRTLPEATKESPKPVA